MKKIVKPAIAVILVGLGGALLQGKIFPSMQEFRQGDYLPFLQWWGLVLVLGIINLPLTSLLFSKFTDKGYLFSKTLGIGLTGYFMWLLSSVHILKFTRISCILCLVLLLLLNIGILLYVGRKKVDGKEIPGRNLLQEICTKETLNIFFTEELLFFGVFVIFTYVRCFKPEAYGTEKFMDYGFMTSMLRSTYMPPQDFWFSGTNLNYYYVGQYLAAFLTRLSFVKIIHGYNLMLMMVGAFAFVLPYSLVGNVILSHMKHKNKEKRFLPQVSGLLAGAAVCLAGNMHYPIFSWLQPKLLKLFGKKEELDKLKDYWFPDATRYIGYNPDTHDKTIHEFPSYSFVLGDLHAHVINIMFVLTVLGILFAWLMSRKDKREQDFSVLKEIFHPAMILIGFFIGLFHMNNFWDYPIYYVVAGAVILFSNLIVYNFKGKALWLTAMEGVFIFVFSEIIALPFTLTFDKISTHIRLAQNHTPLYQLVILWGLPFFMVISFICFLIANFTRNRNGNEKTGMKDILHEFISGMGEADLFMLTIGLCAMGLILLPEIIYVKDIYEGDYSRANTMFKLTYQAFIMFGISLGYLFIRLTSYGETKQQKKSAVVGLVLFAMTLCYIRVAVKSWFGNIYDRTGFKGLDCTLFMDTGMPEDALAADWLNDNVAGMPVVLEANGDSYSDYQRISVITGLPTVLGWRTHEWLWKSDSKILDERANDIQTIYTSADAAAIKALIDKYKIAYIYVGKLEQEKYPNINHEMIKSLGKQVFSIPAAQGKTYETYIVQITKE